MSSERRQTRRYEVNWQGTLTCLFPNYQADVTVRVSEISLTGARISIEKLQVGPHHLVLESDTGRFTLTVDLAERDVKIPISIIWYSMTKDELYFNLGVLFLNHEDRGSIQDALKAL